MKKILIHAFALLLMCGFANRGYAQPSTAAPTPTNNASDVISVYSDAFTSIYTNLDPFWGQQTDATEIEVAGNKTLKYANLNYQGIDYTSTNVSAMEYVHLDYYTDDATNFDFYLIAGGENAYDIDAQLTIKTGQWVSVDIELATVFAARDLTAAFQFKTVGNGTIYLDNLYFWKPAAAAGSDATLSDLKVDGVTITGFSSNQYDYTVGLVEGTSTAPQITIASTNDANASRVITQASALPGTATVEVTAQNGTTKKTYSVYFNITTPATAAPTPPARASGDVISLFSGAYTDISGIDFDPNWGQTTDATVATIADNEVLSYLKFNYQGTQIGSVLDLTEMAYMHIDLWTGNASAVGISPISQTTGEKRVDLEITKYEWVSYDIPLSDFTDKGLGISDIHQLKFDQGDGKGAIYLDNIYFYKADIGEQPQTGSAYCETSAYHFGNPAETASAIKLTITNVDANSMSVEIESADADPVDLLIVTGGSGAAISDEDKSVSGKIKRTLTWSSAPEEVTLNLLWSKESFGGNWQLSQSDITVTFLASCSQQSLVVSSDMTSTDDMSIGDLTVNTGVTLTIADGHTLTVSGDMVIDGTLIINSGASLITFDGNTTGNVTIKRNTRFANGRYSFVGSPVAADASITGADLGSTVYWYDEEVVYGADGLARWKNASALELTPGWGYAQAFQKEISFTGVPNDGEIEVTGLTHTAPDANHDEHGWNLLSNPYPAAISAKAFLAQADNKALLNGSIYLWDDHGSDQGRGDNGDYLTANALGNVNGPNGGVFNGYIGSMQGFFVKVASPNADASVKFTEDMRVIGVNADGNFFRTTESELNLKLSLSNAAAGYYNELLVGLREDATVGLDKLYDADKMIGNDRLQFYSFIDGNKFAIQGLPVQWGISTELGFNLDADMELTLKVEQGGSDFYLLDKVSRVVYDLSKETSFTFTAQAGKEQNRFELVYGAKSVLSASIQKLEPLYRYANGQLNISMKNGSVSAYQIYDLSGKVIQSAEISNSAELSIPIQDQGVKIIRLMTTNGVFTRKLMLK